MKFVLIVPKERFQKFLNDWDFVENHLKEKCIINLGKTTEDSIQIEFEVTDELAANAMRYEIFGPRGFLSISGWTSFILEEALV